MKLKHVILFVLIAATLFAFSCAKKPAETEPETPDEGTVIIPEGLTFAPVVQGSIFYLVQGQEYAGEELVIPAQSGDGHTVTEVGTLGFYNRTNLKKVTLPSTIEKINAQAFSGCTSLTEIILPHSLEMILTWAFENCTSLATITIPNSVYAIASDAFEGCTSLSEITYQGTIEGWNSNILNSGNIRWERQVTIHCSDGDIVLGE